MNSPMAFKGKVLQILTKSGVIATINGAAGDFKIKKMTSSLKLGKAA